MRLVVTRRRFVAVTMVLGFALASRWPLASAASSDGAAVRWVIEAPAGGRAVAEVTGLGADELRALGGERSLAEWQQVFPVFAGQESALADLSVPPMLGSYSLKKEVLRFEPQFPLEPGVKYRAVFRGAKAGGQMVGAAFQLPVVARKPVTVVQEIYPTAGELPENLLKFYLHFSNPMRGGNIYEYIHLRDEKGRDVELPFLQIDEELWDQPMTRLTLFIDPGRIKRGVTPLEEVGPSLVAGHRYTLVIDHTWNDATGNVLKADYTRTFRVLPPDREAMDPARWKIEAPKAGTRQALTLSFSKPVDHALALRVIQVAAPGGELVAGNAATEDQERRWTFKPEQPWSRGRHQIVVQNTLEDLAGNNIGKPFEVDLFDKVQKRMTNTFIKLPVEVR